VNFCIQKLLKAMFRCSDINLENRNIRHGFLILIFIFQQFFSFGAALSIEGTYQGKNLYIQNPMADDGFGYCVTKVTVNGDILPGAIGSSAFEINFSFFNLTIGDPLFIVIEHNDGCIPTILNPEVLLCKSTFEIESIVVDNNGNLNWKTTNEDGKLTFLIEQFKWNKWVVVGEVQGKGTSNLNTYVFTVSPHFGLNTLRVSQTDHSGSKRASSEVTFLSNTKKITKSPIKVKDYIFFYADGKAVVTQYEIFDAYGNIVKQGLGDKIDCSNLLSGAYYINFDNVSEKFIKN
jgi:hypothetical protein